MAARILIVEDEPGLLEGLQHNFQFEGYEVFVAGDGEAALKLAIENSPDIVLLDIMMPKLDGLEVCKRIRQAGFMIPILMLTAKSQEIDIVRGLEMGADDYVTKPFSIRELLARIKAALRRTSAGKNLSRVMRIGDATVDLVKGNVDRPGQTHHLGHFELEILKILIEHAEKPVDRNKLLDVIWGLEGFPVTRTVDNHIVTVHSIGYRFVP